MIFNRRPWMALLLAGSISGPFARGQEDAAGPAPTSTFSTDRSPGASSSFGFDTGANVFSTPPVTPSMEAPGAGASSTFEPPATPEPDPSELGFGPRGVDEAPPAFSLPGFYGTPGTTLTGGDGRLSRPRFRYSANLSVGYDDNIFQTPTKTTGIPDQQVEVIVDPGTPDTVREVPNTRPVQRFNEFLNEFVTLQVPTGTTRLEVVPGTPPKTETITVPGVPAQERLGSFVTQAGASMDVQMFTRRTLFTFDLSASANHYWDRPGPDQTDYNGSFAISFSHRITPRLQTTAMASAAYLTQPDISRINAPTQFGGGDYVAANARADLSYRWTPRFTTVGTLSYSSIIYQEERSSGSNYHETTFGTELRYLWSPRFTALAEGRYGQVSYAEDITRNSTTTYFLLGAEMMLSPKLSAVVRLGYTLREYETESTSSSSPHAETALIYRIGPVSVLSLTSRFGFEEPESATIERQVFRTGLNYRQAFSPRLSASAGVNYLHEVRTDTLADVITTQDTFDASLRMNYLVTRQFSLNASYTFTTLFTSLGFADYHRSRLFIGGEYIF